MLHNKDASSCKKKDHIASAVHESMESIKDATFTSLPVELASL